MIAILTVLLVANNRSKIDIYTDSKNTITNFNSYKVKSNNYRSYIKLDNQIVWELIFKLIQMLDLNVTIHKVKAHSNDKWNDRADEEANRGRENDSLILIKNSYSKYRYQLQYYNNDIDMNPRPFIKKMNNIYIQKEFDNLNRNNEFQNETIDKNISFRIIKEKYRKKGITMSKFRNFKDHNLKAFNVKKLMDELPVIEKLKIRRPDLYEKELNCVRCNKEKETLEHLWECSAAANDMIIIGIKSRNFLHKILGEHKKRDDIIEMLHKYTNLERELRLFHTEENTEFYRKKNYLSFDKKYVWDNKGSLNSLLRGWIPKDLFQSLKKFFNRKRQVEDILLRWMVRLNKWFFDRVWKMRNEKMIEWETKNNIFNKDKRMSIKKKKEIRIEQMIKVKEKRDRNIVDTYHEVKQLVFFSKNLNKGHSYYVLLGSSEFIL